MIVASKDYRTFSFHLPDAEEGSDPYLKLDYLDLDAIVQTFDGIAPFVEPSYHSLVSRTVAIEVGRRSSRIDGRAANILSNEKSALEQLERLADQIGFDLKPLVKMLPLKRDRMSTDRRNIYSGETSLSPALNFSLSAGPMKSRGDSISAVRVTETEEFFREFVVASAPKAYPVPLMQVALNLGYLLAIRRTKLFRDDFASRVYSVVLPVGRLVPPSGGQFLIVPTVLLTRLSGVAHFRPTFAVTFTLVPVDEGGQPTARRLSLAEIHSIRTQLRRTGLLSDAPRQFELSGPLSHYVGADPETAFSVPDVMDTVLRRVQNLLGRGVGRQGVPARDPIDAHRESSIGSVDLLVDWSGGQTRPWETWSAGDRSPAIETALFQSLFYEDLVDPAGAFASRRSVNLRALELGGTHGADISGLTFYNPGDDSKYIVYPSSMESFPNHSILRWHAWQIFIDSAVSSLRGLLIRFQAALESGDDLRSIIATADGLTTEFSEMYDLDLLDYFYRAEYEALRARLGLDSDYERMKDKINAARDQESLREQILINKLILAFTVSTIVVAIAAASASSLALTDPWLFALFTAGITVAAGLAAAAAFEPIRKLFSLITSRRQ